MGTRFLTGSNTFLVTKSAQILLATILLGRILILLQYMHTYRVFGQHDNAEVAFMQRWMSSYWIDSKTILKKPLVFAEFGEGSRVQYKCEGFFLEYSLYIQASTTLLEMEGRFVVAWFGKSWLNAWNHIL